MEKEFSLEDSKTMKGIAIVLMLMHHLWRFPERLYGGPLKSLFTIFGVDLAWYIGDFAKFCVPLYFFLGGYGIYISSKKRDFSLLKQIKKLFISYWKVFLIFVPIGFVFFNNQIPYTQDASIYSRFSVLDWKTIINDFLGLSSSLNAEWWFLKSYIFALLTFPIIDKIFENKKTSTNIVISIIVSILYSNVFPAIGNISDYNLNSNFLYSNFCVNISPYVSCFWLGVLFAKDNLLIKLKNRIKEILNLNIIVDFLIIILIIYLWNTGVGYVLDIIYVPFFIIASMDILNKLKIFKKLFLELGKENTNMWLTHTFFCYYFYEFSRLVVYPKWAFLSLLILIFISFMSSKIINVIWYIINKLYMCITKCFKNIIIKEGINYG